MGYACQKLIQSVDQQNVRFLTTEASLFKDERSNIVDISSYCEFNSHAHVHCVRRVTTYFQTAQHALVLFLILKLTLFLFYVQSCCAKLVLPKTLCALVVRSSSVDYYHTLPQHTLLTLASTASAQVRADNAQHSTVHQSASTIQQSFNIAFVRAFDNTLTCVL